MRQTFTPERVQTFRLLQKERIPLNRRRRLPIRQPGGERAETAASRLDHSAVDNRSSRHHGRRRYPSVSAERLHKPARRRSRPIIPATKHRDRLGRAAQRIPIPVWPERHGTTFVRRASDQAGPDGFRLKHDAKSLGELSRDKPGKRARRNLIPARKPPKIRKS